MGFDKSFGFESASEASERDFNEVECRTKVSTDFAVDRKNYILSRLY